MSQEHYARIELERQRAKERQKRALAKRARALEMSLAHLEQAKQHIERIHAQGLDAFVSLQEIKAQMQNARQLTQNTRLELPPPAQKYGGYDSTFEDHVRLLDDNPFKAQELSHAILSQLNSLEKHAKGLQKAQFRANQASVQEYFHTQREQIQDDLVLEFAKEGLQKLEAQVKAFDGRDFKGFAPKLQSQMGVLLQEAQDKALRHRQELARQEIKKENATKNAQQNCRDLQGNLQKMQAQGLDAFISLESPKQELENLQALIQTDPLKAQQQSLEALYNLEKLQRQALDLQRAQAGANQEKAQQDFYARLQEIKDPAIIAYARGDLALLQERLAAFDGLNADTQHQIQADLEQVLQKAQAQAQANNAQQESQRQMWRQDLEHLKNEVAQIATSHEQATLLTQIAQTMSALENQDFNALESQVAQINAQADSLIVEENARKEVVISIVKTLRGHEFEVQAPVLKEGAVIIKAARPSGKRVQCRIERGGEHILYKFDQYEGLTCKEDIAKFKKELEDVYGFKLEDKKILWENPDRISKGAIDLNNPHKKSL
ncbi:hypothetical protein NHP190002_11490 [Helicobacter ailurogastricus]|uniref:hypothetical protein n=1 Tax=Helicobacter ailurogastricus TaxID=1578720 RepID=UPI00244D9576|nr:hypothetical protein [Helicobacter ailurogastricus]GMB90455.1 hypothetical protein NHP190002_11490 [Helicobacter ailurogastricus]